ncbi:L-rhamnose mutarotase [Hymenobacter sp. BT507]|uniref:L-rhamnose mutarotase n=1 Tax=Hymenobacter citatus TaxID=2763506 RepID=A0ABR7MID3_9BACT|nr:L-rhamnose mutarotase [Hymenobacter citatus]MBC6610823.1 L-rhamnose mutarotase [Hymenobacter citatus]
MGYPEQPHPTPFKRYCKALSLKPDAALLATYRQLHSPEGVWPEIAQGMREVGILHMEIYLLDNQAVMIMDTVPDFDHDAAMQVLATKPRQAEWEAVVSACQQTTATATAAEKWRLMERIYTMDA